MSAACPPHIRLRPPPGPLDAELRPPGSKSLSNRALLLAALARGRSQLRGVLVAEDTERMRACLEQLGVRIGDAPDAASALGRDVADWEVQGAGGLGPPPPTPLFVGTAGTVARFLTAALAARLRDGARPATLDGTPRMRERPMAQLVGALRAQGARIRCPGREGHLPLAVEPGPGLRGGELACERPASSQFVSALAIAACFARRATRLVLREGTPARPYVDMTLRLIEHFGGAARFAAGDAIEIEPRELRARDYAVEADASAASYFLALAAIHGGRVCVRGVGRASLQGDSEFCRVLERMGARVEQDADTTRLEGAGLEGAELDLVAMPDMALTAAVVALFARGPTIIRGVEILRHHESDRLAAAARELRKLGADVEERRDGLRIAPPPEGPRPGVSIATYDDHRMAMAFATIGDVIIEDPQCVAKTFPGFFDELARLGMRADA